MLSNNTNGNFKSVIGFFLDLIYTALPILISLAFLVFVWGLVKFIYTTSSTGKTDGKKIITWGLLALFVMVSYLGIIQFFQSDLEIENNYPGSRTHLPGRLPEN